MIPLLDANQMQQLDRYAIDVVGLPGALLMETAGRGVFDALMDCYGEIAVAGQTLVICGKGNNGGDGFVVARCLADQGCNVAVLLAGKSSEVIGDARLHLEAYLAAGGELVEGADETVEQTGRRIAEADLLVDALFGTGLTRAVEGVAGRWIDWIAAAGCPVICVDLPSGVCADDGRILSNAVRAELTVTFGYFKKGHFLRPGGSACGELALVDIGIPPQALSTVSPDLYLLEEEDFYGNFLRDDESHKGDFGHLAVIAGGEGKMGAAALAALAALKAGAGLVTAIYPAGLTAQARFPLEAMTLRLGRADSADWHPDQIDEVSAFLANVDALVVGPGMGTSDGAAGFLRALLASDDLPSLVLDADGLNLLAQSPEMLVEGSEAVLTPHPGEAARLLGCNGRGGRGGQEVQADRPAAARTMAQTYDATVLLKGAATLICEANDDGEPMRLVDGGNPGMATAGAGDVLSGVIGAFLARGLPASRAANAGGFVHAAAGDLAAARIGMEGLIASDILEAVPEVMKRLTGQDEPGMEE